MCHTVSVAAGGPMWPSSTEISPTIPMRKVPPVLGCADGFAAAAAVATDVGGAAGAVGGAAWGVGDAAWGVGDAAWGAGGATWGGLPHAVSSAATPPYTPNCN